MEPHPHTITRDGVALHVEVEGAADAPPVVFLHGVTGSGRTWGWLPPSITDGRRIIRVDMRGHGRSDHSPGAYTVPDYAADVVAVLTELCAPETATLVGHSLGGVVAWSVAQGRPDLVRAAFLEDPPLFAPDMTAPENAELRRRFEGIRDEAAALQAGSTASISSVSADVCFEDAVAAATFARSRMDLGVVEGAIDGSTLTGVDLTTAMRPPVVVLAADELCGGVFRVDHTATLARTHPEITVLPIPGCGHQIHDERRFRALFTQHLESFLALHAKPVDVAAPRR